MQKRKQRKGSVLFWALWVAFLLSSPHKSASSPLQFLEDDSSEAAELDFTPDEVAAFSNTTANGVRREGVDTALRKYAFMTLSHARTGIIYNVSLPPFLNGILCQAMRVRAGSARRRGLSFNEFTIPQGMIVQTGGPFVIMVYRKIYNFTLYSAPPGYAFAGPVVGIVIYTNLNTTLDDSPLPEMTVLSPNSSIVAKLDILYQTLNLPHNNSPLPFGCAYYDINGTASFTNISTYPNICSFKILTDVAIIVPASVIAVPASPPSPAPAMVGVSLPTAKHASNVWKIVVLAVVGGVVGLALLIAIIVMGLKVGDECQMTKMDEPPDDEETLQTSLIGHTRAPTAAGVRTRPVLETGSLHT
ncbi:hypothetical protein GOP47_0004523 [Adiantum capillus-veneris]|uniref:Uncharacterized protein n=1 Tax=Adiantum capillus-veneris TaxID=13818 RepID=A0A9D4ZQE8_ADICA|nr:hypothetical protein GOP47_0004523 [Adiantum capillus-veneris]